MGNTPAWSSSVFRLTMVGTSLFTLASCYGSKYEAPSTDAAALQKMVRLPFPVGTAEWGFVVTPEPSDVVGRTDYETLMVVIRPAWPDAGPPARDTPFVPNAARSWLPSDARAMIAKSIAKEAPAPECRGVTATLKSNSAELRGMSCRRGDYTLLYLIFLSPK